MSIQLTIAAVYRFSDHIVPDKLPTVRSRQTFFHLPNKPVIEVGKERQRLLNDRLGIASCSAAARLSFLYLWRICQSANLANTLSFNMEKGGRSR